MKFENIEHELIYTRLNGEEVMNKKFHSDSKIMEMKKLINFYSPMPVSNKGVLSPLIVLMKKLIMKLMGWYLNPFIHNQNQVNANFLELILALENNTVVEDVEPREYGYVSYAQSGEDLICFYILKGLGIDFKDVSYLDLGANDYKELSNTYFFYELGARGVLVEANSKFNEDYETYRSRDVVLNKIVYLNSEEKKKIILFNSDGLSTTSDEMAKMALAKNKTLVVDDELDVDTVMVNEIVAAYFDPAPTILSVDLEGIDLAILQSIDFETIRPAIVIVETINYDTSINFSERNEEIVDFMESQHYVEYAFTGINSIFVNLDYRK